MADFATQLAVAVTIAIAGVGYWTFKPEIDKHFQKDIEKPISKSIVTTSSADKRKDLDEYVNHLRKDILEVLESKNLSYFESLCTEKQSKKMILQHMFTFERAGAGHPSYNNYHTIWAIDNALRRFEYNLRTIYGKFYLEISEICRNKRDFTFEGELKQSEFLHVLGFPSDVDIYSDDSLDFNKIRYVREDEVNEIHFHIEQDYEDKSKYYVKYQETVIAECKTKKIAEKLLKSILSYSVQIIKFIRELQIKKDYTRKAHLLALEEWLTHLHKLLEHGKPNFGVCEGCFSFFPHANKERYGYFLYDVFNDNPYYWQSEEYWH